MPNKIRVRGVTVTEAVLMDDTEMLIGMDIIALGDFSVTNLGRKSCMSFRIQSVKKIDYVEEILNSIQ